MKKIAAVIPIRLAPRVKTRLNMILSPQQRICFVLKMLGHMIGVLEASPQIARVYVATSDKAVVDFLGANCPRTLCLPDMGGINESACAAADILARDGFDSMLYLLGDLPLLNVAEVEQVIRLGTQHSVVILPDHHRSGTNGLLLTPPNAMKTHFGPSSFNAHLNAAYSAQLKAFCLDTQGFARDIDTPEDLEWFLGRFSLVLESIISKPDKGFFLVS